MTVKEVDFWLTRFILEARRADGKPYPANTLYSIATGLMRHFKDNIKRFDLNILSKNDANFSSFRNALDSKMKKMTIAGIGTTKSAADPGAAWPTGTPGDFPVGPYELRRLLGPR